MTATVTTPPPTPVPSGPAPLGVTHIADRVVAKIAARAAAEIDNVRPAPATGLARLGQRNTRPTVDAHVNGTAVTLTIELGITYPAPIRTVATTVHHAVRSTVERLTGLDVLSVRVELVALPIDRPSARRVI